MVATPGTNSSETSKKSYQKSPKKSKAVRRLQFDEDKSSPVSGTIIRDIKDCIPDTLNKDEHSKYEETALGIQVTILVLILKLNAQRFNKYSN